MSTQSKPDLNAPDYEQQQVTRALNRSVLFIHDQRHTVSLDILELRKQLVTFIANAGGTWTTQIYATKPTRASMIAYLAMLTADVGVREEGNAAAIDWQNAQIDAIVEAHDAAEGTKSVFYGTLRTNILFVAKTMRTALILSLAQEQANPAGEVSQ